MSNKRGMGLIDVTITLFLVTMAGLMFTAAFPSGFKAIRQGKETKKAVEIAQRKIEQIRAQGFGSLSYSNLLTADIIDAEPTTSSYSFTETDDLDDFFSSPEGKLAITEDTTGIKTITITIKWNNSKREVELKTLVADKSMRKRD